MNPVQYPLPVSFSPPRSLWARHAFRASTILPSIAQLYFAHPHPNRCFVILLALLAFRLSHLLSPSPPLPPFLLLPLTRYHLLELFISLLTCTAPHPNPICTAYSSHLYSVPLQPLSLSLSPIPRPRNLSYSISRALFVCHPVLILQSTSRLIRSRTIRRRV
ncbi:hypothetical protein FKP32DRAFT_1125384 [Trametes sanguinea]|nr:hypothetical protein FKP32DRAFT_1125384 [Trametes sanguinea]